MFNRVFSLNIILAFTGGFFFFSRGKNKKNDELIEEEEYKSRLLCRFVLDGAGKKVGESVGVDEDILIIKSGSKYLGVPIKHIEEEDKTLLVKGLLDKDKAEIMGEKWRRQSFREINNSEEEKDEF